jgi:hypothetical protein
MKLRNKTFIAVVVAFLCLLLSLYGLSEFILMNSFLRIERKDAEDNVERALNAYSDGLSNLNKLSFDWAAWDDTYRFVEDLNEDYVSKNILDNTLGGLNLNVMILINSTGQVVFAKAFDLEKNVSIPMPDSVRKHISENVFLLGHSDAKSIIEGVVLLPEGPMLMVSRPILPTSEEGPVKGTFIIGRYLSQYELMRLSEVTRLSLSVSQINDPDMPSDFREALNSMSSGGQVAVLPLSPDLIACYKIIKDLYGQPALILRVDSPRVVYRQGLDTLRYFFLTLLLAGAVFSAVTLLLLEKLVLSRLTRLSSDISGISRSSDPSSRVTPMKGRDELSSMGYAINEMLASLEHSQRDKMEAQERYVRIVSLSPDGVLVHSEGRIVFINNAAAKMIGGSNPWDLVGKATEEVLRFSQESLINKILSPSYASGGVVRIEGDIVRNDGTLVDVEVVAVRLTYLGKPALQISIHDITERKKNERMREEFFSSVTHELKTPITSMISFSESLYSSKLGELGEKQRDVMGYILQEATRLRHIVDRILTFSRLEHGVKMNLDEADLEYIIGNVLRSFMLSAAEKKITLSGKIPLKLPKVVCDTDRITDVLNNLVGNALKFTPVGGDITVEAACKAEEVLVKVSDTGIGMSEDQMQKIFTKFYQVGPVITRVVGGSGLGLYISKRIVEGHGGSIWVESAVGTGTTFYFTLPINRKA